MGQIQFTSFYLGETLFGIDVNLVREVNSNIEITPVYLSPPYVRGLLNLRGQIVTIIDPGIRLGLGVRAITRASKVIIQKTSEELAAKNADPALVQAAPNDNVGLLVDVIGDMITLDRNDIEFPPANVGGVDARFLQGVVKLEKQLMIILKPGEVTNLEN